MANEENKKQAEQIVDQIKELVKKGNISRIQIKKDGDIIVNLPLNVGVVGTVIGLAAAPWAVVTAAIVTYGTACQVELHTTDGRIIDVSGKAVGEKVKDVFAGKDRDGED